MTAALNATGLVVRRGRRDILDNIDLTVGRGEIVAIMGPNGAGKSTLLGALGATLPVHRGSVQRSGRVATVLQSPGLARRTARANVELALAWWRVPRRQRRPRAEDALRLMRADHLARRQARSLSGGEQRRIHLARAVAVAPDILLLDEPFDGLDPQTHAALRDDTSRALREAGGAVVVVLHDRADTFAMADRVVVVLDGRIHADGPPQSILENPPSAEVARFLGYDGELLLPTGLRLTRPTHVAIRSDGEYTADVLATIGIEDGLRVHLRTEHGEVWSRHHAHDIRTGDAVRINITGGTTFNPDPSRAPNHP